ncbi:hypothetical protein MKY48_27390 [Paenibacillus sp. FSL W8-0187]
MDHEQRLSNLEKRVASQEKKWRIIKIVLITIVVIWLVQFLIGLTQFLIP